MHRIPPGFPNISIVFDRKIYKLLLLPLKKEKKRKEKEDRDGAGGSDYPSEPPSSLNMPLILSFLEPHSIMIWGSDIS